MKIQKTLLFIFVLLFFSSTAFAVQTFYYPPRNPSFSISFPSRWSIKTDKTDLNAFSPDKKIEMNFWPLKKIKKKGDISKILDDTVKEVGVIIDEYVNDFEIESKKRGKKNGIDFYLLEGSAESKDDKSEIDVSVTFFSPDGKQFFVNMYWGEPGADKKYATDLKFINASMRKPTQGNHLKIPAKDPSLKITFPKSWKIKKDGEGGFNAFSPKEDIEMNLWAEDNDGKETIEEAAKGVGKIIAKYVKKFKFIQKREGEVNHLPYREITGIGISRETGKKIVVSTDFVLADEETWVIMIYWGAPGMEKKYYSDLVRIMASMEKIP